MESNWLFRGKHIHDLSEFNGKWVYGDLVTMRGNCYIHPQSCVTAVSANGIAKLLVIHPVVPATVGQYTGLCDKNRVLVFEGDRIKLPSGVYYSTDQVGVIRYDGGSFMWVSTPSLLERRFNSIHGNQDGIDLAMCEVVGNIHDGKDGEKECLER